MFPQNFHISIIFDWRVDDGCVPATVSQTPRLSGFHSWHHTYNVRNFALVARVCCKRNMPNVWLDVTCDDDWNWSACQSNFQLSSMFLSFFHLYPQSSQCFLIFPPFSSFTKFRMFVTHIPSLFQVYIPIFPSFSQFILPLSHCVLHLFPCFSKVFLMFLPPGRWSWWFWPRASWRKPPSPAPWRPARRRFEGTSSRSKRMRTSCIRSATFAWGDDWCIFSMSIVLFACIYIYIYIVYIYIVYIYSIYIYSIVQMYCIYKYK